MSWPNPCAMTLAATSKHIKVLERVGLVRQTVAGRQHVCRLDAEPLTSLAGWLRFYEQFWTGRLDAMEILLRAPSGSGTAGEPTEVHPGTSGPDPMTEET